MRQETAFPRYCNIRRIFNILFSHNSINFNTYCCYLLHLLWCVISKSNMYMFILVMCVYNFFFCLIILLSSQYKDNINTIYEEFN